MTKILFCGARTKKHRRCTARSNSLYAGYCEIHGQRAIIQRGTKYRSHKVGGRWNRVAR